MQTAAAYIRVSTDDQLEYSPDSQLDLLREYAKRFPRGRGHLRTKGGQAAGVSAYDRHGQKKAQTI